MPITKDHPSSASQEIYEPGLGFICLTCKRLRATWMDYAPAEPDVGAHLPLASRGEGDVDEATGVEVALVGAAFGGLLLLLLLNLELQRNHQRQIPGKAIGASNIGGIGPSGSAT
jgi:hypothetical protein